MGSSEKAKPNVTNANPNLTRKHSLGVPYETHRANPFIVLFGLNISSINYLGNLIRMKMFLQIAKIPNLEMPPRKMPLILMGAFKGFQPENGLWTMATMPKRSLPNCST